VTPRHRLATVLLWSVLVLVGTMFGASVYQRISLIPEWGGSLPQSVADYFRDPRAGQAIDRFWTLITAPTAVAIILALIVNWPLVAGGAGFRGAPFCFSRCWRGRCCTSYPMASCR
jgi:hypothetical protein